jgi:hypothetical protein
MSRRTAVRRGPPDRARVDDGSPWGPPRDRPSEPAWWWIGPGVEPIWNPAGRPACDPRVERGNGLTQRWGELRRCADRERAAEAPAEVGRIRREGYPAIRGRTRPGAFPRLGAPRRVYRRAAEEAMGDLARADAVSARGCWGRRADRDGKIPIYGPGRSVGRCRARRGSVVRCDAASRCGSVSDQRGGLIERSPASELARERILALAVSRRR